MSWPWSELGLRGPAGLSEIRSAYAQRLKTAHPEEDPEGFQRLHAAYQEASRQARRNRAAPAEKAQAPSSEGEAPHSPPEEEAPAGPDHEAPVQSGEGSKSPPKPPEPRAPEWDYGALLEGSEKPRTPPEEAPKAPEWDFDRLFAEGEEENREARRRRLEDLRHKNWDRYVPQARQRREADEEESWPAVLTAVRALEFLERSDAPQAQWQRFLDSSLFLSVRADMDFVFLLEDFLRQHPELSPEIRRALFAAYEAQNASKYPAYKPLYRLLGVERKDRRREAKAKSAWRNAWRSYPPWRKAILVVCFAILAVFFFVGWAVNLKSARQDLTARREAQRWQEQAPKWLEEDYGEPFTRAVSDEIFTPAANPELYFRASPYGERSEDWPGYQTNYPHILVKQALEDFAGERELDLKLASYSHEIGDAPGAYLLNLPLLGAEEDVAALGQLLEDLSRQDWYQVPPVNPQSEEEYRTREPVKYTVYLCHRSLAFYEAPSDRGFDAREALDLYAQAGPAFCRWILEHSGLAEEHLGAGYVLRDQGELQIGEETFFQVSGLDGDTGEVRVQYLLSGGMLFCIPQEKMESIRTVVDLYRGTPRHLQLDNIGLIMVTDQMPEK